MKIITGGKAANEAANPLDALAVQGDALQADSQPVDAKAASDQADQDKAQAAIETGVVKIVLGLLKAARSLIARKLPEIKDEWPDELLQAPADAAVPLLRKHLAALMEIAGANPELAVFAIALFPLVTGYLAAAEAHDKKTLTENTSAQEA